jgi:hypothetical protein
VKIRTIMMNPYIDAITDSGISAPAPIGCRVPKYLCSTAKNTNKNRSKNRNIIIIIIITLMYIRDLCDKECKQYIYLILV